VDAVPGAFCHHDEMLVLVWESLQKRLLVFQFLIGNRFEEAGIPHVKMIKKLKTLNETSETEKAT
jgi:predicted GNAT family N-acyltransferase